MENSLEIDLYDNSLHKKWIKKIPDNNNLHIDDYEHRDNFILVADIVLDNEVKETGEKQRQTVIKWEPSVGKKTWTHRDEWIYIFTINGIIVKFGGTRTGLKSRIVSYLCGHQTISRVGFDKMSQTNAYIYNTFEFYLNCGYEIKMYGFKLPKTTISINILGNDVDIIAQTYHAYESIYISNFTEKYYKPYLSDNSSPDY